jgi:hypothetical protein
MNTSTSSIDVSGLRASIATIGVKEPAIENCMKANGFALRRVWLYAADSGNSLQKCMCVVGFIRILRQVKNEVSIGIVERGDVRSPT